MAYSFGYDRGLRGAIVCIFIVAACGDSGPTGVDNGGELASIVISPATPTVAPGDSIQLTAVGYDDQAGVVGNVAFNWNSSNSTVATVSAAGRLRGLADGAAVISASSGGVTGTTNVTVEAGTVTKHHLPLRISLHHIEIGFLSRFHHRKTQRALGAHERFVAQI
jgi:hypothetical protein